MTWWEAFGEGVGVIAGASLHPADAGAAVERTVLALAKAFGAEGGARDVL